MLAPRAARPSCCMSTCASRSLARLAPSAACPLAWHAPLAPRPPLAWHVPPPPHAHMRGQPLASSPPALPAPRVARPSLVLYPRSRADPTRGTLHARLFSTRTARPPCCSPARAARSVAQLALLRGTSPARPLPFQHGTVLSPLACPRGSPPRATSSLRGMSLHVPSFPRGTPTSLRVHPRGPSHCPARPPRGQFLSLHVRLAHSRGSPFAPPRCVSARVARSLWLPAPLARHVPPPPPSLARLLRYSHLVWPVPHSSSVLSARHASSLLVHSRGPLPCAARPSRGSPPRVARSSRGTSPRAPFLPARHAPQLLALPRRSDHCIARSSLGSSATRSLLSSRGTFPSLLVPPVQLASTQRAPGAARRLTRAACPSLRPQHLLLTRGLGFPLHPPACASRARPDPVKPTARGLGPLGLLPPVRAGQRRATSLSLPPPLLSD